MAHTLHVIGWLGCRRAYLDVSLEDAKRRYAEDEGDGHTVQLVEVPTDTFTFNDTFGVYDAYGVVENGPSNRREG